MSNEFKYTYYVLKVKDMEAYFSSSCTTFYTNKTLKSLSNLKLEKSCGIVNAHVWYKKRTASFINNGYEDMINFLNSRPHFKKIFDICEVEQTVSYNITPQLTR